MWNVSKCDARFDLIEILGENSMVCQEDFFKVVLDVSCGGTGVVALQAKQNNF